VGVASVVSAVFVVTRGDPWQLVKMTAVTAPVAVVLGLVACLAARRANPSWQAAVGAAYLLAALVVLAELAFGFSLTDGSASTFSLWLGLGLGLAGAGRGPRDRTEE
jgi:uncharacterized membrane protein